MEKKLHNKIKTVSYILFLTGIVFLVSYFFTGEDVLLAPFAILIGFSFITISSSYAIRNMQKGWIIKTIKYSFITYPITLVAIIFLMQTNNLLIILPVSAIIFIFTTLALMYLFLQDKASSIRSTLSLLIIVFLSIIYRRYHLPFSVIPFTISTCWFAIGIFMYGIRCLYLIEDNKYFRSLSFFVSLLVTFTFLALLFKMMHWPVGGVLLKISNFSMVVGSIVILITIPSSGYIDWPVLHKKILRKLLFPWIFIFVLFLFHYLVPEAWDVLWNAELNNENKPPFEMLDYPIENKNGLD